MIAFTYNNHASSSNGKKQQCYLQFFNYSLKRIICFRSPVWLALYFLSNAIAIEAQLTTQPSLRPSAEKTSSPTRALSLSPSINSSSSPSKVRSLKPTATLSASPTSSPTKTPSLKPSLTLSDTPSLRPTVSPTTNPSSIPTVSPTTNPSSIPTVSPTTKPSSIPSSKPTFSPSLVPSSLPSVFPTSTPSIVPSPFPSLKPSEIPTSAPTLTPTMAPTKVASSRPTGAPSESPSVHPTRLPTISPTDKPSLQPSVHPTRLPSSSPTKSPTSLPSNVPSNYAIIETVEYLSITLFGYGSTKFENSAKTLWEQVTSKHISDYYNDGDRAEDDSEIKILSIETTFVDSERSSRRDLRYRLLSVFRNLSGDDVEISYKQTVNYRITQEGTSEISLRTSEILAFPFATDRRQGIYVESLKTASSETFGSVTDSSSVTINNPPTSVPSSAPSSLDEESESSLGILIGSVVGAVVFVALLFGAYIFYKRRKQSEGRREDEEGIMPVINQDEGSTLAEPTPRLGMISSNESIGLYGDQSIATQDYDYAKAYGNESITSSAGGTFGSIAAGKTKTSFNESQSIISKNSSFDALYGNVTPSVSKENYLDVYCPPGKLGVVIDTPDSGPPVVHGVKDSSVVANQIRVGDKVVAVDDEDVRTFTAIKVSKMISRKSANPTRKLTILRKGED